MTLINLFRCLIMLPILVAVHGALWATCLTEIADLQVADVLGDTAETATDLASKVGANATTRRCSAGLRLDRVIPTESAMAILESTPV